MEAQTLLFLLLGLSYAFTFVSYFHLKKEVRLLQSDLLDTIKKVITFLGN